MVYLPVTNKVKKAGSYYRRISLAYFYSLWLIHPNNAISRFDDVIRELIINNKMDPDPDKDKYHWNAILNGLVSDGYIEKKDDGYWITQKGRDKHESDLEKERSNREIYHTKVIATISLIISGIAIIISFVFKS